MSECFICGETLKDLNNRQANLKIYREKDKRELSISFDNSLGAFGNKCKRIHAYIFLDEYSTNIEGTFYISDSKELSDLISNFVNGII